MLVWNTVLAVEKKKPLAVNCGGQKYPLLIPPYVVYAEPHDEHSAKNSLMVGYTAMYMYGSEQIINVNHSFS